MKMNMCKYCSPEDKHSNTGEQVDWGEGGEFENSIFNESFTKDSQLTLDDKMESFMAIVDGSFVIETYRKINYCPYCGRKL